MLINGKKVPYVEVAYEFARNPSSYSYVLLDRRKGGARVRNKRALPLELPIPVIFSRRDTDKSWDEIKEELAGFLYREEDAEISFTHGDGKYYIAQVVAIEISEEHEYVSKGSIVIVGEDSYRYGEEHDFTIIGGNGLKPFNILGQVPTNWRTRTVFKEPANSFILRNSYGLNILLNYKFIVGDVLEIDYKNRDVFLNGKDLAVSLSLSSVWGEMPVGNIQFEASHETKITYIDRYY